MRLLGSDATNQRARRFALTLLFVALLAFVARVGAMHLLDTLDRYTFDSDGYLLLDGRLSDDVEYEGRGWNLTRGESFWGVRGDGNGPPLYCLWIAALYSLFGRDIGLALLSNGVLGAVAAVGTVLVARRTLSDRWSLLAGLAIALNPQLIYWAQRLTSESLSVAVVPWIVLCVIIAGRAEATLRQRVACGTILGLSLALRDNMVVFFLAYVTWWLLVDRPRPQAWSRVATVVLAFAAVVVPLKTLIVLQRPVEIESHVDQVSAGGYLDPVHYRRVVVERAIRAKAAPLTAEEREQALAEADQFLREASFPRIMAANWSHEFLHLWRIVPTFGTSLEKGLFAAQMLILIIFGLVGLVVTLRSERLRSFGLYAVIAIAGLSALHTLAWGRPRYRLLVEPLMWVLVVHGVRSLMLRFYRTNDSATSSSLPQ